MRSAFGLLFVLCSCVPEAPPPAVQNVEVPPPRSAEPTPDAEPTLGTVGSIVSLDGGYETRTHEPSPEPLAKENRERCARGEPEGCHAAALDAYYSPSSPETDAAARDNFQKACDLGYAPSCNGLGLLHHEGRGVKKDDAEAARWYYRSCLDGSSTGCDHLADAFSAGRGLPKNPKAAARALARKACLFGASLDGGSTTSCPALTPPP